MKLSLKKKPCICFSGNAAPHQVNGYNLGSHLNAGQINGERHFRRHRMAPLRHWTGMLRCATCDQPPGAAQRSKQTWPLHSLSPGIECLESEKFVDKVPKFVTSMKSFLFAK